MTAAGFGGFTARGQSTAIPNTFFVDVLPALVNDPLALVVALYSFRAVQAKRGSPRFITAPELVADASLVACVRALGADEPETSIDRGLAHVAGAGVLLALEVEREGHRELLYFLNAPSDRRGMEAVRTGTTEFGPVAARPAATGAPPSVFSLYESLAGTLGPGIAEELMEAERLYPAEWLESAFREAAAQNARSWRYVSRILERWASEGRDGATTERDSAGDERYFRGKYGRILRRQLER